MNYETASDLEINKRLTEVLHGFDSGDFSETSGNYHKRTPGGPICSVVPVFDYCNSIMWMWPLILEHNVSLLNPACNMADKKWTCASIYESGQAMGQHENPLRAAAICIIQLLEQKQ